MRKSLFVGALIGAIALTSCDTEHESRQTMPVSMMNYTVTSGGEAYSIGTSTFTLNYTSPNESGLRIEGLDFVDANTKVYDFENLTLKSYTEGFSLEPNNTTTPMPTSLKATMLLVGNMSYNINMGGNTIIGVSLQQTFYSTTVVANAQTGEQVKRTDDAAYNRFGTLISSKDLNTDKRSLNLYIFSAAFMEGMPSVNMVFKDVNFAVQRDRLVFSKDELIPEKVNSQNLENTVPQERFKITDLAGSITIGGEGVVSFVCNYEAPTGEVVPFRVQSVLKNNVSQSSSNSNNTNIPNN